MKKGRLLIALTTAIMLSLSGFLTYYLVIRNSTNPSESGTASAMTVPNTDKPSEIIISKLEEDNSGNYTYIPPVFEYDDNNDLEDAPIMDDILPTPTPWAPATEMDLDPESITVFVNKEFALPKDYVPKSLVVPDILFDITGISERKLLRPEAAYALEQLFKAAQADGYILYGISGYRSYERQAEIFTNNIVKKGKKHTLRYSAVPGTSEHQTGLAIDISTKKMKYKLVTSFAKSPEGIWLADNAHYFGYIVRYPENRAETTGYAYEPWHIRYVGKDLAKYLYTNNMTLEEYYNYVPSKDFDFEALYAEYINYIPPEPTPDPNATPVPVLGDLDGDGIVDDLDGDGIPDYIDEFLDETTLDDNKELPDEGDETSLLEEDEESSKESEETSTEGEEAAADIVKEAPPNDVKKPSGKDNNKTPAEEEKKTPTETGTKASAEEEKKTPTKEGEGLPPENVGDTTNMEVVNSSINEDVTIIE